MDERLAGVADIAWECGHALLGYWARDPTRILYCRHQATQVPLVLLAQEKVRIIEHQGGFIVKKCRRLRRHTSIDPSIGSVKQRWTRADFNEEQ